MTDQPSSETNHDSPPKAEISGNRAEREELGLKYKSWPVLENVINFSEATVSSHQQTQ